MLAKGLLEEVVANLNSIDSAALSKSSYLVLGCKF
jgi:hypothetical protein